MNNLTAESIKSAIPYLERLYKIIPGLEIKTLTTDAEGEFVIDAVIPQKVVITKK